MTRSANEKRISENRKYLLIAVVLLCALLVSCSNHADMDSVVRHSLMIYGVIYSFMGSGSAGVILGNCVFLGEKISAAPIDEYPTENLKSFAHSFDKI